MAENVGSSDIWSDGVEKKRKLPNTDATSDAPAAKASPTRKGGFYHKEDDHQKACFCCKEIHGKETSFYHKKGYF